jgi:CBS domain-containing protein
MHSGILPIRAQNTYPVESRENGHLKENKSIVFLLTAKASIAFLFAQSSLRQGLEKMRYHRYTAMPVIAEDGAYIGTVNEGDFLWHMLDNELYSPKAQECCPISNILRVGWNPAVKIDTSVEEVLLRIMEQNFVPVVDDRGKFIGIITRKTVLKHYQKVSDTSS